MADPKKNVSIYLDDGLARLFLATPNVSRSGRINQVADRYTEILLRDDPGFEDFEIEAVAAAMDSISLEPAGNIAALAPLLVGPLRKHEAELGINADGLIRKIEKLSFVKKVLLVEAAERMINYGRAGE